MQLETLLNVIIVGLTTGAIYSLVGMTFNISYATTNVFNFAQGEFLMVGAMVGALLLTDHSWPMLLALTAAVIIAAVLGAVEELIAVRPVQSRDQRSHTWFLSTLAVSIILTASFSITMGPNHRVFPQMLQDTPWRFGGVRVVPQQLLFLVLALVIGWGLHMIYTRTLFGAALGAVAQDRDAAALRGIPVKWLGMAAFALSTCIAGLTGFVIAPVTTAWAGMGAMFLFKGFIASTLGGIPNLKGAMIGGLLLGVAEALAVQYFGAGYGNAAVLVVLVVVLLLRPQGLFGVAADKARVV